MVGWVCVRPGLKPKTDFLFMWNSLLVLTAQVFISFEINESKFIFLHMNKIGTTSKIPGKKKHFEKRFELCHE